MRRLRFLARFLVLAALPLAACADMPEGASGADYACQDGGGFSIAYNRDGSLAQLQAGGRRYSLAQQPSNAGRIYSDGIVVLRLQDDAANATGAAGGPYRNCRLRG